MAWETVIGLEIHVQLSTQSKIFSGSAITFGAEPNTQASLVDLGMPGVLPVLNEDAIKKAITFGVAIDAKINKKSVFARKNYFYPDLPKGYQISQLDLPIVDIGHLDITLEDGTVKRIGVTRAHLEEDAGKSLHEDYHGMSGIDLNRAGTPLIEIVSEPEMRNAKEAVAYFKKIHSIVTYLGICDGDLSQGSMRCDCNVSLRPKGQEEFGTRTEIKNVNSFRFVEQAINVEIERQRDILEDGGTITQETRLFDANKMETRSMRSKEVANDYRYFPCPDLLPIVIDDDYIEAIRKTLPELPDAKKQRLMDKHGLSEYDARILTATRELAAYFEQVAEKCSDYKLAANWVMGELSGALNKNEVDIQNCPISADNLGAMIARIKDNTISGKGAKSVFQSLWNQEEGEQKGDNVDSLIDSLGLKQVSDSGAIESIVDDVLANNDGQVQNYINAEADKRGKMIGFFVGQVMKASKGSANPGMVNKVLKEKLDGKC